jgi:hypothetical protein
VICGVFALALGIFAEWKFAPFIKDASLARLRRRQNCTPFSTTMPQSGQFIAPITINPFEGGVNPNPTAAFGTPLYGTFKRDGAGAGAGGGPPQESKSGLN